MNYKKLWEKGRRERKEESSITWNEFRREKIIRVLMINDVKDNEMDGKA